MPILTWLLFVASGTAAGTFFCSLVGLNAPWWAWMILSATAMNFRWGDGGEEAIRELREEIEELTRAVKGEPDDDTTPEP